MKKLDAYGVYLLMQAGMSLFFALVFTINMVYQVETVGLSPLQLVLVGTTLEASVFVFEMPTGIVADVYSRRLSVIIGTFLIGLGFILEGAIPLFPTILLAQVLWGLGYTFTSGADQAWISDEIGEAAAGKAFLLANQVSQVAGLGGIGLSVLLGGMRLNLPILAAGGCFLLLGLFLFSFMPEEGFTPAPEPRRSPWKNMARTLRDGLGAIRLRPALAIILGIGLFYGLYSEGYDRLWTKHLLDNFTLPSLYGLDPVVWFGIIRAVGMLSIIGVSEVFRRRLDTQDHLSVAWVLMGLTVVLVSGLFLFAQARTFLLALAAIWVISITRGVISPIYTAWVNQRLEPRVRATVLSMSGQVDAIGQIITGPFMGLVGNLASIRMALTVSGLILSPVLGLYVRAIQSGERALEEPLALE